MSSNAQCVCRYCGKVYHSISGLHSHESSHRGTAPYKCCSKQFYSKANYLRHRCSKHNAQKLHLCGCGCQKSFATNADLQRHRRREVVSFTCEICSAVFMDKATLKDHMDKHEGSKRHTCGCGKAFRHLTNMYRHRRRCEKK